MAGDPEFYEKEDWAAQKEQVRKWHAFMVLQLFLLPGSQFQVPALSSCPCWMMGYKLYVK